MPRVEPTKQSVDLIGTVYTATWKASSSSANATQLTNKLTLPAGTYIIIAKMPYISVAPFTVDLNINSGADRDVNLYLGQMGTWVKEFSQTTDVWLISHTGGSCNFTYTERGGISAVRVA